MNIGSHKALKIKRPKLIPKDFINLKKKTPTMSDKRRVAYFYDGITQNNSFLIFTIDQIANVIYGHDHIMKPKRIAMTHSLINHYNLYSQLYVYVKISWNSNNKKI